MGLFDDLGDLINGFTDGFFGTLANGTPSGHAGLIPRLCHEVGWSIDEQDGDTTRLHFRDPLVGVRKLRIFAGEGPLVSFYVNSFAALPARSLPEEVPCYLLLRNSEIGVGAWQMTTPDDDGDVLFLFQYCALAAGLDPDGFKFICEKMLREALAFDEKMHKAGLLRLR